MLVDTNILLYLLAGNDIILEILQGKNIYISFITELELLGFKNISEQEEKQIHNLLNDCSIINMTNRLKEKYVEIRKRHNLKLADAIVAATALAFDLPLITADKQFRSITKLKLVAYESKYPPFNNSLSLWVRNIFIGLATYSDIDPSRHLLPRQQYNRANHSIKTPRLKPGDQKACVLTRLSTLLYRVG
ncbi:type II toxin-antitoxin system VapC family toxin [Mucilaginibacter sp. SP1R1]|uniref:type II toxin-antitoxin system VapC family toxin n=1 Tax=Mucilaginibacter sp. SP1R1 TaxID=2723091 RepID=UPI003AFFC168